MTDQVNGKPQRILDLDEGVAMVVTDLHGDWDAYQRYRNCFLARKALGEVDHLILLGDMIHHYGPASEDKSIDIMLDLLALKQEHEGNIHCLLGNHEVPHIYSILLQKGNKVFTPRFEQALGENRMQIVDFFDSLPFYLRTKAGVTLAHAGATTAIGEKGGLTRLRHFSHQQLLQDAREMVTEETRPSLMREMRNIYGRSYNELARTLIAVSGINDSRYDDFLIGTLASTDNPEFDLLWATLFTRNEHEYGESGYKIILNAMLQAFSVGYHPQVALVSGHIDCQGGHHVIDNRQLRLASAKHAHPREDGLYLLFDTGGDIESVTDLLPNLHSVF